jgi:hypothetical protein
MSHTFPKYIKYHGFECSVCKRNLAQFDGIPCILCMQYAPCDACKQSESGRCNYCAADIALIEKLNEYQTFKGYYQHGGEAWECKICKHFIVCSYSDCCNYSSDNGLYPNIDRIRVSKLHYRLKCAKLASGAQTYG